MLSTESNWHFGTKAYIYIYKFLLYTPCELATRKLMQKEEKKTALSKKLRKKVKKISNKKNCFEG